MILSFATRVQIQVSHSFAFDIYYIINSKKVTLIILIGYRQMSLPPKVFWCVGRHYQISVVQKTFLWSRLKILHKNDRQIVTANVHRMKYFQIAKVIKLF